MSEKTRGGRRRRRLAAGFLILAVLLFVLGPSLLFRALLTWTIPAAAGLTLSYQEAWAGPLFRSARVKGLRLKTARGDQYSVDQAEIRGLKAWNFLKLIRNPEALPAGPLFLARELTWRRFRNESPNLKGTLELGRISGLTLALKAPPSQAPLHFDQMELRALNLNLALGGSRQAELSLEALTAGGLQSSALARVFSGGENQQLLWRLLSCCDSLNLAQAGLKLDDREAFSLKSALFAKTSLDGANTIFTRRLSFAADLAALPPDLGAGPVNDLRAMLGDRFQGELALELAYQKPGGRADLRRAVLDLPDLGRLNFSCLLSGVSGFKPHQDFYQILYGPAARGQLEKMSLAYEDRGLVKNIYRHLERTVFRRAAGRPAEENILEHYINPLARGLEYERGLSNLPDILSEVEAFLRGPESFSLSAEPARPLAAIFKNPDKYDIIEKLRPILTVNRRAPVPIGVASGVFQERLPVSPQPMEKAFTEEDI